MKSLFIKLPILIALFGVFLVLPKTAEAKVAEVEGHVYYKIGETKVPFSNVWVRWQGQKRVESNHDYGVFKVAFPPEEGNYTRYELTNENGKYLYPWWDFYKTNHGAIDRTAVDYRAKEYLTWIKPNQPEIPPDLTAVRQYEQRMSNVYYPERYDGNKQSDLEAFRIWLETVSELGRYQPQGEGWVRKTNTVHVGVFDCHDQPTFSTITPTGFKGNWEVNNVREGVADFHGTHNGDSLVTIPDMVFAINQPVGYHDGDGVTRSGTGNLNSCSIYGWAKNLNSTQKYDVKVFVGGPNGSGVPSFTTKADKPRGDPLSGFGFDVTIPAQYQTGEKKDIYVYAVDTDGSLTPLAQTPRSLVCGTPDPNAPPTPQPIPLSPKVDIWAESGSQVTGRGTPGGTLKIRVDQITTIAWTAQNSSSCVGSGNWAGIKSVGATRVSQQLTKVTPGVTYNYTLTCFNNETGEQESDTVIVSVNPGTERPFIQTEEGDVHSNEGIDLPN